MGPAGVKNEETARTSFTSIFRCSPEIVNLAFSVTSSGATLFTNFDDPLAAAASMFTEADEKKCASPTYELLPNDEEMIRQSFQVADQFVTEMQSTRGDVAIVCFGNEVFADTERFARNANKPIEIVQHRGDFDVVRRARNSGRFVLSTPDYIGGLEFDGVILVGVDKGRVPPKPTRDSFDSANFVSYATHQRLYVAITRARYRITILGVKARGISDLLANAVSNQLIVVPAVSSG
jgi:superfamily I DNA/RNA helicase